MPAIKTRANKNEYEFLIAPFTTMQGFRVCTKDLGKFEGFTIAENFFKKKRKLLN